MEVLYLLIPLVLLGVAAAVGVLFWAIKSGQYDDLEKESQRILFDDPEEQRRKQDRRDTKDSNSECPSPRSRDGDD